MSVTSNPSVTGVTLGDIKADGTVPFVSDVTINTGNLVFDSGKGIDFSATAENCLPTMRKVLGHQPFKIIVDLIVKVRHTPLKSVVILEWVIWSLSHSG